MTIRFFRTYVGSLLLLLVLDGSAQSPKNNSRIPEKYGSIDLSAGMIFMPDKTSSPLFGQRPAAGFQESFAVNYAFSADWMAYAAIGYNFYHNRRPAMLDPAVIGVHGEEIIEALFGTFENIKPTLDAGIMYRLKFNKWEILPKIGLSYTVDDWGRNRQLTFRAGAVHLDYKLKGDVPGLKWGLSSHYWVSEKGMLLFGLQAEHPLQKPSAAAVYLRGGEVMTATKVKSSAYGRNFYFQMGYGFALARRY